MTSAEPRGSQGGTPVPAGEEERIRAAVRIAVNSCRQCGAGPDCVGALMDLFRYLPTEVRAIVEDEQARTLEKIVGGD